ncbi:hypothetical protein [Pacificispira sp.]|uniref:hypothetical protein n=1 Tax=Pacificispira sp. TaxID=2888761 RepID=UPI003BA9E7F8
MTQITYSDFQVIKMTATLNAVADSTGEVTLGTVPAGFVVVQAFVDIEQLTTNNEIDIGPDGGNLDAIFDGLDPSSGAVAASWNTATVPGVDATTLNRYAADTVLVATNVGSAATPSSDKTLNLYLIGYRDYTV